MSATELTGQLRTDTMIPRFSVSFLLIICVSIIIRSALNNIANGGNSSPFSDEIFIVSALTVWPSKRRNVQKNISESQIGGDLGNHKLHHSEPDQSSH